jgi:hypothetical protein
VPVGKVKTRVIFVFSARSLSIRDVGVPIPYFAPAEAVAVTTSNSMPKEFMTVFPFRYLFSLNLPLG